MGKSFGKRFAVMRETLFEGDGAPGELAGHDVFHAPVLKGVDYGVEAVIVNPVVVRRF